MKYDPAYEYCTEQIDDCDDFVDAHLAAVIREKAAKGWRMVGTQDGEKGEWLAVFKREKVKP